MASLIYSKNLILFIFNLMIFFTIYTVIMHYQGLNLVKHKMKFKFKEKYTKYIMVIVNLTCGIILVPSVLPQESKWIFNTLKSLLILVAITTVTGFFLKKRNRQLVESRNFYKIFKYIFTQLDSGAHLHQTFKTVYHIVDEPSIKRRLLKFSLMLTQEHQIDDAMLYLNDSFKSDEGRIFISVMQNIEHNSMTSKGLVNVDQMLFQKYLSSIRAETKKIERQYILLIVLFTFQIMIFLMLPLLSQMVESAQNIFK